MVELFRTPDSPLAGEVEAALQEMVIGYRVVVVDPAHAEASPVPVDALPALRHGDDVVTGEAALRAYLASLRDLMQDWVGFGADACMTDRHGRVC